MPVTRVFVALDELLGVADADPVGDDVALEVVLALDVGDAEALVDEAGAADELAVDVETTDGDDELLGVADVVVEDTGVALAVAGALLAVGVGSIDPVRVEIELDDEGVEDALALLVEAEGDAELDAVGLALKVTVDVGEAEGASLDVTVGEAICMVEALEVGLGVVLEVTVGGAVAVPVGFTEGEVHFSGMLVTVVITPPTSVEAITGIVAKMDNTTAVTVLSATRALRFVRTMGKTDAFMHRK